jgi:hypothetical protein
MHGWDLDNLPAGWDTNIHPQLPSQQFVLFRESVIATPPGGDPMPWRGVTLINTLHLPAPWICVKGNKKYTETEALGQMKLGISQPELPELNFGGDGIIERISLDGVVPYDQGLNLGMTFMLCNLTKIKEHPVLANLFDMPILTVSGYEPNTTLFMLCPSHLLDWSCMLDVLLDTEALLRKHPQWADMDSGHSLTDKSKFHRLPSQLKLVNHRFQSLRGHKAGENHSQHVLSYYWGYHCGLCTITPEDGDGQDLAIHAAVWGSAAPLD